MTFTSFNTVPRIVHQWGCVASLPEEIGRLVPGAARVLIVSDPGIAAAGILERIASILSGAGLDAAAFAQVASDPAFDSAEAGIAFAKEYGPDIVVGVGGGSSMDIAKLTAALLANPGPIGRYVGMEVIEGPGVPLVLIPTTAGTGSEVTSICVLSDTVNQVKKGIVSRHLFARAVLLDAELTVGLPPRITAMTGMDALVHAIESYTGKRATPFTDALNIGAIRIIAQNLRRAFDNGADREARENMLSASCMAGMAFSNTQNALDHALALAVGGRFHLPHGTLTAMMMPRVMGYNLDAASAKYAKIAEAFGEETAGMPERQAAGLAVGAVRSLLAHLGISTKLSAYGIPRAAFSAIAKATVGGVRLISNNPREVSENEVVALLEETGEE